MFKSYYIHYQHIFMEYFIFLDSCIDQTRFAFYISQSLTNAKHEPTVNRSLYFFIEPIYIGDLRIQYQYYGIFVSVEMYLTVLLFV